MRIRQHRDIGRAKTDQIFGLWDTAFGLLEGNPKKALSTMAKAWALHPGDKLEWSTASVILHAYVQVLNFNGQHKQALALVTREIEREMKDEEAGYPIMSSEPWIYAAETALFLGRAEQAKDWLEDAYYLGKERAFAGHPPLYLKLAKAKRLDGRAMLRQWKALDVNQRLLDRIRKNRSDIIKRLCEEGNVLLEEKRDYAKAIATWQKALAMVDEATALSPEATWLHGSLGEAYYLKRDYKQAVLHFRTAVGTADGVTNPFLLMRAGQSLFELHHGFARGGQATARQERETIELLLKAYMIEGRKVFDNPRHLAFLKSKVKLK